MQLFRSEEHVTRWMERREVPPGVSFTPAQCWDLAQRWHADRLDPDWRRKTPDEAQAVFAGVGLTGEFWQLHK